MSRKSRDFFFDFLLFKSKYPFIKTGDKEKYYIQVKGLSWKYCKTGRICALSTRSLHIIIDGGKGEEAIEILYKNIVDITPVILKMFSLLKEENVYS